MAEIFVRVHSPLFFYHFLSMFLQMRLSIQFTTFKSLFTPNVQFRVTLSLLNCSLFMLSVQILVILSLFNCDLVTLGVQILVTAPKFVCTRSRLVLLQLTYLGRIVDLIVLLFLFGTGCVDGSGSLSGGAFNQLK